MMAMKASVDVISAEADGDDAPAPLPSPRLVASTQV